MKKITTFAFTCMINTFFAGCDTDGLVKQKIISYCKHKDECIFDLRTITPFAWDTMYQFRNTVPTDLDSILLPLGVDSLLFYDAIVVFLSKGKLVHYELYNTADEGSGVGEISFLGDTGYHTNWYCRYSSTDARFLFERHSLGPFSEHYHCWLVRK